MAYVIAEPCITVKDSACVNVCPVDCIHPKKESGDFEAAQQLYIDPDTCIDCGACVPECPVSAIFPEPDVKDEWKSFTQKNADYFKMSAADFQAKWEGGAGFAPNLSPQQFQPKATKQQKMPEPQSDVVIHSVIAAQPRIQAQPKSKLPRVFMSYSSKDEGVAVPLSNYLKQAGLECWLDKKEIVIGEPILDKVREGIMRESDYTLIILSENSVASEWCKLELRMAYEKEVELKRVVVLPTRIDQASIPEELRIKKYYQLDSRREPSFHLLIEEIKTLIARQTHGSGSEER